MTLLPYASFRCRHYILRFRYADVYLRRAAAALSFIS